MNLADGAHSKELFFLFAAIALAAALYFALDRAMFLSGSVQVDAEVLEVLAVPGDCGKGKHECTKFMIRVGWSGGGEEFEDGIEVGQARGYGATPPADLGYAVGDRVPLRYDPADPSEHYRADQNDMWYMPLGCFAIAAFLGLIGVAGRKKIV